MCSTAFFRVASICCFASSSAIGVSTCLCCRYGGVIGITRRAGVVTALAHIYSAFSSVGDNIDKGLKALLSEDFTPPWGDAS